MHLLKPNIKNTFWVCLIGHDYAYPRRLFRWCTPRLKVAPSNDFVQKVCPSGEVVLVLGTRKAESSDRAKNMEKYEMKRRQDYVSPSGSLQNQWVFSSIENWSTDDVWNYLLSYPNPWGISNDELLNLYNGASDT